VRRRRCPADCRWHRARAGEFALGGPALQSRRNPHTAHDGITEAYPAGLEAVRKRCLPALPFRLRSRPS